MSDPTFVVPVSGVMRLPDFFESLTGELNQLLASVGLKSVSSSRENPDVDGTGDDTAPTVSEDEAASFQEWVDDLPDTDPAPPLDDVDDTVTATPTDTGTTVIALTGAASTEISFALPLVSEDVAFVVSAQDVSVQIRLGPTSFEIRISVTVRLRFSETLLVPVQLSVASDGTVSVVPPAAPTPVEITLGSVVVIISPTVGLDVSLTGDVQLSSPAEIGSTGVIVEKADIALNLTGKGDRPDGAPSNWTGVLIKSASVRVPAVFSGAFTANELGFGSGGVTGTVGLSASTDGKILGMTGNLTSASVSLKENIPVGAAIGALVQIPFFDFPTPVEVDISLGIDGTVTATLSGGKTLISLERSGLAKFDLKSLTVGFEHGEFFTSLTGALTPEVLVSEGLSWPTFDVKELRIDSAGHVTIAGGWIDLPSQKSFSLYGFTVEITKIGFGTQDDGHRWIGFSGGISLVSGIKAGASVKGLRIIFPPDFSSLPSVSLEGAGLDFEIPNALAVTGSVSLTGRDFQGAVKVVVEPISLTIDGQFVTGTVPNTNERYFGILLHGELPTGIPLGATGLAIYGFAGLYGQELAPDKKTDEDWFENPDGSKGWYQRDPVGVDDLSHKWKPTSGAFAFGAGVTLGTYSDNGYEFSGRLLLVLSFPGPTILIDGRANLFKKRSELSGNDPTFRALAVIQPGQSFLLGLAAHYKYQDDGKLLDIQGSAEAFFDFNHADNWHIFLGRKDPKLKSRISANIFKLFDVNGYFELTPASLAIGAGWSFDKKYGFGSLDVHVQASFQTDATVSWHPNHYTGDVILDGSARLEAFGHGVGVKAHADVTGDVFDPFHLHGSFSVGIDLPWPLPDLGGTISFDWQETLAHTPALPLPLREATVEHTKRMLKWPVPRDTGALLPNNDGSGSLEVPGSAAIGAAPSDTAGVPASAPRVPADSAVGLTFSRPIGDKAGVSVNPTGVDPETIGDLSNPQKPVGPYTVQYQLSSLSLEKRVPAPEKITDPNALGPRWVKVAEAHGQLNQPGVPQLFAAWSPAPTDASTPTANSQQLKLLVNAKTPFDYGAQQLKVWDNWFDTAHETYPCQPPAATDPNQKFCLIFVDAEFPSEGNELDFSNPDFSVTVQGPAEFVDSVELVPNGNGSHRSLGVVASLTPGEELLVVPPVGTDEVDIQLGRFDISQAGLPTLVDTVPKASQIQNNTVVMPAAVLSVFGLTDPHDPNADLTPGPGPGKVLEHPTFNSDGSLQLSDLTEIALQPPATAAISVELDIRFGSTIDQPGGPDVSEIITYDEAGTRTVLTITDLVRQLLPLKGPTRIVRVVIRSAGARVADLFGVHVRTPVSAIATSREGSDVFGPYEESNGALKVLGEDIGVIKLGTPTPCEFTVLELCTPNRTVGLTRHTISSLDLLADEDFVFDPQADYRMVVTTRRADHTTRHDNQGHDDASIVNFDIKLVEQAYFHVVAPPGIETPDRPVTTPPSPDGPTGFEDLRFYLASTVPDSTPASDGKPVIPRAFYRSYDPSIAFNEPTKVEKMYRLARRDLTLRLFDAANAPVLDADGRAVVPTTRWDTATQPTLTDAQQRWVTMVNAAACRPSDIPPFDPNDARTNQIVSGPAELALLAETLYQAHLVPALLHEPFVNPIAGLAADGTHRLERWIAVNDDPAAAGRWVVDSADVIGPDGQPVIGPDGKHVKTFFATETIGNNTTLLYDGPIGAAVGPDQPANWTDFRASAQLRMSSGTVALVLRYGSSSSFISIAFARDVNPGVDSRLVTSVDASGATVLASDNPDLGSPDTDLVLTVDCIGSQLVVRQPGLADLNLTLPAGAAAAGPVGLSASAAPGCRFAEIRVDDLRVPPPPPAAPPPPAPDPVVPPTPSTALRFDFITSKYVNFAHHLASFDDQTFAVPSTLGVTADQLNAKLPSAVPILAGGPTGFGLAPPSDGEKRAFDDLELAALGQDGRLRAPDGIEILNATHDLSVTALLIRSPEPFQWERTHLAASVALSTPNLQIPGDVKMVGVSFGSSPPDESVTLILRAGVSLAGFSIQWRHVVDTNDPDPAWTPYFTFGTEPVFGEGTGVLVFSGSSADAPAREPGTQQRFVAADAASAVTVFPADNTGVELRVLDPTGAVVHQREFKPTGNISQQIGVNVIRKGDGTALFLFSTPQPGATRPPGIRLDFVFTRNPGTTTGAPPFPILRQAGSDTAEVAALEFALPAT